MSDRPFSDAASREAVRKMIRDGSLGRFDEATEAANDPVPHVVWNLLEQVEAAEREAERLRHGVPIEGDLVCPSELALSNVRLAFQRIADAVEAAVSDPKTFGVSTLPILEQALRDGRNIARIR